MLITRYLIRNLFIATLFIVFTLTTVIWLSQSMKLLELIANSDAPAGLFLKLVFLSLPKFLEIILPLSLVTAVLFTYNKMIHENELVVMRACGMDQLRLARPALMLAGIVTIVLILFSTWLSPMSRTGMIALRQSVKAEYSAFLLREGVFNTFGNDITVYLRARGANGDLYGLMIHDVRDKKKPPVTITAKKGRIVMEDGVPTIVVFDGMRQQPETRAGTVSKLYFARYTIEIKNLENDSVSRWREANERTLPELFRPDATNPRDRAAGSKFSAEINNRLVTPFNALSFTLMALTCILLGSFNRRGHAKKILLAAGLVVAAQAFNLGIVSLMKNNPAYTPALYIATLGPPALCLWLLTLPGEQALAGALRRWRNRKQGPA
jgi:lipopolysaccharide export system permease protein